MLALLAVSCPSSRPRPLFHPQKINLIKYYFFLHFACLRRLPRLPATAKIQTTSPLSYCEA